MSRWSPRSQREHERLHAPAATATARASALAWIPWRRRSGRVASPQGDGSALDSLPAGVATALLLVFLAAAGFILTDHPAMGVVLAALSWGPVGLCCFQGVNGGARHKRPSTDADDVAPASRQRGCAVVPAPSAQTRPVLAREAGVRPVSTVQLRIAAAKARAGMQASTERGTRAATPASSVLIHVVRQRGKDEVIWESLLHLPPGRKGGTASCLPPG